MAVWVGVDVGGKRKGFDVAVIDDRRVLALQGHLTCRQVVDIVVGNRPAVVAIDSPRSYAPEGRAARDGELQLARSICRIRWTPDARRVRGSAYYAWILEGVARSARLLPMVPRSSRFFRLPRGLAGTTSEAPRAARPGLGRDWQPSVWKRSRAHEPRPARRYCRCDDRASAQSGPDGNDRGYRRANRPLVTCESQGSGDRGSAPGAARVSPTAAS
jgi:hypothetical protein